MRAAGFPIWRGFDVIHFENFGSRLGERASPPPSQQTARTPGPGGTRPRGRRIREKGEDAPSSGEVAVAGSIPAYVMANKVDLVDQARLEESTVESFCQGWGSPYLLTSAKTGENVRKAFARLALMILESHLELAKA